MALSHRNLPIVPYLRDRVALLATASLALQQQLRQQQEQQQEQQQQAALNATASAPAQDPSSSSPIAASPADTQAPADTTAESSTPTTSPSTSSALSGAPAASPSAPPGAPFPLSPSSSTTTGINTSTNASTNANTNQPGGPAVTFLSSAQVDAVIQQALPLLPAATTQGSVRLPAGVNISYDIFDGLATNIQLWLEISVDRNRLLPDLIEQLDAILKEDSNTLFLPLK